MVSDIHIHIAINQVRHDTLKRKCQFYAYIWLNCVH